MYHQWILTVRKLWIIWRLQFLNLHISWNYIRHTVPSFMSSIRQISSLVEALCMRLPVVNVRHITLVHADDPLTFVKLWKFTKTDVTYLPLLGMMSCSLDKLWTHLIYSKLFACDWIIEQNFFLTLQASTHTHTSVLCVLSVESYYIQPTWLTWARSCSVVHT